MALGQTKENLGLEHRTVMILYCNKRSTKRHFRKELGKKDRGSLCAVQATDISAGSLSSCFQLKHAGREYVIFYLKLPKQPITLTTHPCSGEK